MTFGQIIFWLGITLILALPAIVALIISYFHQRTSGFIYGCYAVVAGDLYSDNNARSVAFFVLAILLTISALIGGFGKPLLDDSVDSVVTSVKNWEPKKLPMPKEGSLLWGVLTRDDEIKITPPVKVENGDTTAVANKESKHYPSWWWWLSALGSWLLAIVYFPLSRRDEVFQFIDDVWNRCSTIKAEATIPGDEQPNSGSVIAEVGNLFANLKNKTGGYTPFKDFSVNMLSAIIMEKFFSKKRTT